eukprot:4337934-Prymnesium_polylepis.1
MATQRDTDGSDITQPKPMPLTKARSDSPSFDPPSMKIRPQPANCGSGLSKPATAGACHSSESQHIRWHALTLITLLQGGDFCFDRFQTQNVY